jgi:hypothetical protein
VRGDKLNLIISIFLCSFCIQSANSIAFQLIAQVNEVKTHIEGEYEVVTKVIWSSSPYVKKGQKSISELYIDDINGKLYSQWHSRPWKIVKTNLIEFKDSNQLRLEQDTKFDEDLNNYWYVQSAFDFDFEDLEGKAYHKEFLNGEYVGAYITKSYLKPIN